MRYIILLLLNLPIILLALVNFITKYKLGKISVGKLRTQLFIWFALLVVIIGSFPVYNTLSGRPPLDAHELSLFDIVQITAIILLFYVLNNQRQRLDNSERRLRDLHQELSIKLSQHDGKS